MLVELLTFKHTTLQLFFMKLKKTTRNSSVDYDLDLERETYMLAELHPSSVQEQTSVLYSSRTVV